jgi:glycosyltransferase involved in cell wall biosynthesis
MLVAVWQGRRRDNVVHVEVFSGGAFVWGAASAALARFLRKPVVLTLHGGSLPEFAARWPGAVRHVLNWAQIVTVPSEFLRRRMQPYRSDLCLLSNPLDVRAYPFRIREKPEPRLVWMRAFDETYNPSLAPRVLAELTPDHPTASLTMIGPDKGDGSLARVQACARELGVERRIRFVGGVPKNSVGEHLSRGDVFLNTTNVDNAPVSVLEALACGLGVVSTNVGGMPDFISDGEDGLLVPPDDAVAMAGAVRRLLWDPGLAARLSRNGRRKAEAMDWSVVLPRWETLLSSASANLD